MTTFSKTVLFTCFFIIISLFNSSHAQNQNCSTHPLFTNNLYKACNNLPTLNSFIHWNYHQLNHTVDIAYRHTGVTTSNWIAWCLNPSGGGMIGSQCLIAYRNSTGLLHAYTSSITSYATRLEEGSLSFRVPKIGAEFNDNEMIIYASLELPNGTTKFAEVWQYGPVSGDTLGMHPTDRDNMRSIATIDFATAQAADATTTTFAGTLLGSRNRKKNVHGVMNVVSWGILMPVGAMAARYLKVFKSTNSAWFYIHVTCQSSAYIVGVAGFVTGMKLGRSSPGVVHTIHRNIGITLFVIGTLQAFAILLRPKPEHKYRKYWNAYHQAMGYSVLILSIINILDGLDILDPGKKWKRAYIGVLIFLGSIVVVLEAFTWYIVLKRKRQSAIASNESSIGA
ncbi:hypothetical protein BUALT_Bualt18G0061400 [Buddleja alternifolia]|uniref:Cytochrome b561 and DOMON domain-containing protein n=1 Tax=Buddleja alternifolia TaxID=168488 RepID=A0AAV6W3M2_9LAMI|nr:hypothetical protein BUALT_Bualt18G0061400 [Buddleja alternifolia]